MKIYSKLLLTALLVLLTFSLSAQLVWDRITPNPTINNIWDTSYEDGLLYILTDDELFVSNDQGESWELLSNAGGGRQLRNSSSSILILDPIQNVLKRSLVIMNLLYIPQQIMEPRGKP